MQRADLLEKTLMLGNIEASRIRDNRGWDGWMASPTRWTWVWVDSRSWRWAGWPGVLQFMRSQRARHDWATEQNWTPGINNWGGGVAIRRFPFRYWATYSVLTEAPGPLSFWSTSLGLSGQAKRYYFSGTLRCNWDSGLFWHEFLIVPESHSPLLGRDILNKVYTSVFMNMEPFLSLPLIEQNVNPRVWADGKSVGQAQSAIPVVVKLKHPHLFPH